ncbi:MAG: carboxymuconolactone decarboxylase family protein [Pseudomonadales bacterium]|nr:carboxymuconolactone decarboxylase family protein [Pseudomonadales bacterium]
MKTLTPRIEPLAESKWTEEEAKLLGRLKGKDNGISPGRVYNIIGTLANHWKLYLKFGSWGNHILGKNSTLGEREREILILRVGWLCQAEYEWGQHVLIGKKAGLTDEEISRIKEGANAPGWSAFDALLIKATDELHDEAFVSDETWKTLAETYNTKQMMDLVFTVGQYNMVSMALNSFGVQLDEGLKGF